MKRSALPLLGLVVLVIGVLRLADALQPLLEHAVLLGNDNTQRDFQVYANASRGIVPLQGPITSLSGHHGWLAYWLYGLTLRIDRSLEAIQAVTLGTMVLTWLVQVALARRVATWSTAAFAAAIPIATHTSFFLIYPNHISLISLGTATAFLGLALPSSTLASLTTTTGIVITIGAHRTGWVLLFACLGLTWWLKLDTFRRPTAWFPIALYLIPDTVASTLGERLAGDDGQRNLERWWTYLDPLLTLRQQGFAHVPIEPFTAVQAAQLLFIGAVIALSRRRLDTPGKRAIWLFYVANFCFYPFLPYDQQYYLPMYALLPALAAMATEEAIALPTSRAAAWVVGTAGLLLASNDRVVQQLRDPNLLPKPVGRSYERSLDLAEWLTANRATELEITQHTHVTLDEPEARWAFMVLTFAELAPDTGEPPRCFEASVPSRVTEPAGWTPLPSGLLARVSAGPCEGNAQLYRSPLWYYDTTTGDFVQR